MQPGSRRTVEARLQTRLDHLNRLGDHTHGLTIDQANTAFRDVHATGSEPASILIRRLFICRPRFLEVAGDRDSTPRAKPLLATAIRPKGVLLKLQLTLLFLAQCQKPGRRTARVRYPVDVRADEDGLGLIDFLATGSNRREKTTFSRMTSSMRARQVRNALDSLAAPELQLVEIGRTDKGRSDYDHRVLLHTEVGPRTTGDQEPYRLPGRSPVVSVPIEFFTNGWLHVLTDSEIANWLMWRDVAGMRTAQPTNADDLMIWARERLGWYDLSRDVWDTHQMLTRLNLMTVTFAAGRRTDGTLTDYNTGARGGPHHFGLDDRELGEPALPAARKAVAALVEGD